MAQPREVARAWLVLATLIVLSYAVHSPNEDVARANMAATLVCSALTVLHVLRWLPDRLAIYLCGTALVANIVHTAVNADGFAGMSMIWPIAVAFPTLALLHRRRFLWWTVVGVLTALSVAWAQYAHVFATTMDAASTPWWWWQSLAWLLLLLVALPALMHYWQMAHLAQVHQQSLRLEQMGVELGRQTLRQHRFLAHVTRFLRVPLHEVWLEQRGQGSPKRSSPLMAAVHDLYTDLANLQDSGALDEPEWNQNHPAPLNARSFFREFEAHPPDPVAGLSVSGATELPPWLLIDQKRLSQLFTNLLRLVCVAGSQRPMPEVSHGRAHLQLRFQWTSVDAWARTIAGVLEGEREFPAGLERDCLRLMISQQLAQAMGGVLELHRGQQREVELSLSLPAPIVEPGHVIEMLTQRLQIAFIAADGAAHRELHELFRPSLLGQHAWRLFRASTLPELGFDVVILILDDWDAKDESTRQFFERLQVSNAQIWGVTNGLSIEQVSDWRALAVQRIWLRPIDDTAWQYHLRGAACRVGAGVDGGAP